RVFTAHTADVSPSSGAGASTWLVPRSIGDGRDALVGRRGLDSADAVTLANPAVARPGADEVAAAHDEEGWLSKADSSASSLQFGSSAPELPDRVKFHHEI